MNAIVATTSSSLVACNRPSVSRPSATCDGWISLPFNLIEAIEAALRSTKVDAPGSAQSNRTTVREPNSVSDTVRSRSTV